MQDQNEGKKRSEKGEREREREKILQTKQEKLLENVVETLLGEYCVKHKLEHSTFLERKKKCFVFMFISALDPRGVWSEEEES